MPDGDALLVVWIRLIALAGKCNANGLILFLCRFHFVQEIDAALQPGFPCSCQILFDQIFVFSDFVINHFKGKRRRYPGSKRKRPGAAGT